MGLVAISDESGARVGDLWRWQVVGVGEPVQLPLGYRAELPSALGKGCHFGRWSNFLSHVNGSPLLATSYHGRVAEEWDVVHAIEELRCESFGARGRRRWPGGMSV